MMHKLYLVTFEYLGSKFFKIGITSKRDVEDRFRSDIKKYKLKNFKIHISSYFNSKVEAENAERLAFEKIITEYPDSNYIDKNGNAHFHNVWFDEKVNGITEIRKYSYEEYKTAYNFIKEHGFRYIKDAKNAIG